MTIDPPPEDGVSIALTTARCGQPSTRHFGVSRITALASLIVVVLFGAAARVRGEAPPPLPRTDGATAEVIATAIGRPIQLAFDPGGRLVVLGHGFRGDVAGEIRWLDVGDAMPIDGARSPRLVIPYTDDARGTALGSLVIDPRTGRIYLGEENGHRVHRLGAGHHLTPVAIGIQHLLGGSAIALDATGHLVVLDFASLETQRRQGTSPTLDAFSAEDYQGPLVFRVDLDGAEGRPRRLDLVTPLFPRGWARPQREPLTRFISVLGGPRDALILLDSLGEVQVLTGGGDLRRLVRLPAGHYHRTNLALAPDGSVYVSTGFHIRALYRVSPSGRMTVVARDLGDPAGIAVDAAGRIYVAEAAFHRILRLSLTN
jgi:hypothetical protein